MFRMIPNPTPAPLRGGLVRQWRYKQAQSLYWGDWVPTFIRPAFGPPAFSAEVEEVGSYTHLRLWNSAHH